MVLPIDFIRRTEKLLGNDYAALEQALQGETPVSIRMNVAKGLPAPDAECVPWSSSGYYLPQRLSFTFDPLFHAGAYYVQEASSMFLEQAIRQYVTEPVRCLDLCAAPGGKTTHLATLLPEGSLLVSNEVIRNRSYVLAENRVKWGYPNGIVTSNTAEEIGCLTHLFDVMVTDVPCSGEGMFRKDADSIGEWSVENVALCASRQREIITSCWDALRPGGLLVYSTCTYNTEEDEENVHYIAQTLGADVLPISTEADWQISGPLLYDAPVYRFFPHKTKGEGFFLALLRKHEDEICPIKWKSKKKKKEKSLPLPAVVVKLAEQTGYTAEWDDTNIRLLPPAVAAVYPLLQEKLHILSAGLLVGECKGNSFIPAHDLALSIVLSDDCFPSVEVDWETAMLYLRRDTVTLPSDTEKGFVILRYRGFAIGFAKHLGNRTNNLYPQEWRIRSSHLPEQPLLFQ